MGRHWTEVDPFQELTWDDLHTWAGSKIVSRGRSYQRSRSVRKLAQTPSGGLVAWVEGSTTYATRVEFEDGELDSECTCPYWDTCKHAVAVVLEYLECLKTGSKIPKATEKDERMQLLLDFPENEKRDEEDEDEQNMELDTFLKQHTKTELIELLLDLSQRHPIVRATLQDRCNLSGGSLKKIVNSVRKEIRELSAEPGWTNHWNNEGYIPDYSRVRERLDALLAHGHADEVVELGRDLLEAGTSQVEMSHDEGETANEIASCLEVVFQALPQSSLTPSDQILWAVEAELEDKYELCYGVESFWKHQHAVSDWSIVADRLLERLNHLKPARGADSFLWDYHRDRVSDWVIRALKNADRDKEIIHLCEKEAEKTGSYVRLVNLLKEAKRLQEAEEWIYKGIKATEKKLPGIADTLRSELREMRQQQGDWLSVAALRADDFFRRPSLNAYKELRKAAQRAKVWKVVRVCAMTYLETGKIPAPKTKWPLPETGVKGTTDLHRRDFPATDTLIDVAIDEKQPDDVIRWYERYKKEQSGFWGWTSSKDNKVAEALVGQYPDRSVDIWKTLAERHIALTKPKEYEVAGGYLLKIHQAMKQMGKEKEWKRYLAELQQANIRKKRFIEVVDRLEKKRILQE